MHGINTCGCVGIPAAGEREMVEVEIGEVTHWYGELGVAGIDLIGLLRVGDRIHIKGHTTDFQADVETIEIEHERVGEAPGGVSIGLRVPRRVREHDHVYVRVN